MNIKYINYDVALQYVMEDLGTLLDADPLTMGFKVLLAVGFLSMTVIGVYINRWIGGSSRGLIGGLFGFMLPLAVGLAAHAYFQMYPLTFLREYPQFENIDLWVSIFGAIVTLLFVTPFFLGTPFLKSLVVYLLAVMVAVGALNVARKGLDKYNIEGSVLLNDKGELIYE